MEQQTFSFGLICFSEKAMAPHSSTLAWKIPWMEKSGGLQSMGSLIARHDWATSLSLFTFHALEKEMATHSSVLAWRIPGMAGPGGLPSLESHRVGHDWSNLAAAAAESLYMLMNHLVSETKIERLLRETIRWIAEWLNTEFVFTYTFYFQIEDGRARKLMKLSLPVSRPFSTVRYLATSVTCLGEPLFAGSL